MKKGMLTILFIIFVTTLFANSYTYVVLKNNRQIYGDLVGKKDDIIYLKKLDKVYIIEKDNIKKIMGFAGEITNTFFRKADFMKIDLKDYKTIVLDVLIPVPSPEIKPTIEYYNPELELLQSAGENLRAYSRLTYIGFAVGIVSSIIIISSPDDKNAVTAGSLISLGGFIIALVAPSKVGIAGKNLEEYARYKYWQTQQDKNNIKKP